MSLHSICATNNKKGAILVFAVGIMIVVAVLALALIMLSTSQIFLVQTQKKELQGYYGAEAQVYWVAYQLQADPYYDGEETYPVEGALDIVISVELQPGQSLVDTQYMIDNNLTYASNIFEVAAYVEYSGVFGKEGSAVRLDAVVKRIIERSSTDSGTFRINTEIENWQQIKPPVAP